MIASLTPATASEIRAIVGDLDDAAIAAILATGATAAEVTEAFMRNNSAELDPDKLTPTSGRIAEVCAILDEAEADLEEE